MTEAELAQMVANLEAAIAAGTMGRQAPPPMPTREDIAAALIAKRQDIKPGVPQGLEGTPGPDDIDLIMQAQQAQKQRADAALIKDNARANPANSRYDASDSTGGRMVILPGMEELWTGAKNAMSGAGEAAMAMPLMGAMGAGSTSVGGAVRGADAMLRAKMPALYDKLAGAPARAAVPPVEGGLAAQQEAAAVEAFIKSNKGQIKVDGTRLTKAQQRELIAEYMSQGGRLPQAGPWGRDIRADTIEAITEAARKRKP